MMPRRVCWVVAVSGCLAGLAFGDEGPTAPAGVETRADEVLRKMSKYLAAARQFSFAAEDMADEVVANGQKIQLSSMRRLSVRRPNRVLSESAGDVQNLRTWYDGKTLTVLDKEQGVYSVLEGVPDNIDAMLDYVAETFGIVVPIADLLFSDVYATVISQVRTGWYVGLHHVQGAKCHHLAFQQDGVDWQIWIAEGDRPVPRKLVITFKAMPGQPQYIALLGEWNMSAELPDSLFVSNVPAEAKKIDIEPLAERPAVGRMPAAQRSD